VSGPNTQEHIWCLQFVGKAPQRAGPPVPAGREPLSPHQLPVCRQSEQSSVSYLSSVTKI